MKYFLCDYFASIMYFDINYGQSYISWDFVRVFTII